ncbi:hypothetical protein EIK79_05985 [Halocatena pleomorpha]|uniref:Uncharacterized protein n=1 Tax=Halocatena pleomorpha TaxID=1785090 RepID=A0A3P3RE85_9EURY|nr:hypothetical protein EIK79_05985 [Halocatena pleomorpha]
MTRYSTRSVGVGVVVGVAVGVVVGVGVGVAVGVGVTVVCGVSVLGVEVLFKTPPSGIPDPMMTTIVPIRKIPPTPNSNHCCQLLEF